MSGEYRYDCLGRVRVLGFRRQAFGFFDAFQICAPLLLDDILPLPWVPPASPVPKQTGPASPNQLPQASLFSQALLPAKRTHPAASTDRPSDAANSGLNGASCTWFAALPECQQDVTKCAAKLLRGQKELDKLLD